VSLPQDIAPREFGVTERGEGGGKKEKSRININSNSAFSFMTGCKTGLDRKRGEK